MSSQLPLGIALRDSAAFANYLPGRNREALHALQQALVAEGVRYVFLWGSDGCGKTHLLQAACHETSNTPGRAVYLPLSQRDELAPQMLAGLEQLDLVCLDDIQCIAGRSDWEEAVFHLYNRLRETGGCLVIAADAAPSALGLQLPDLESRLSWGVAYHLHRLSDDEKIQALQLRATGRGVELPEEVAVYLLRRSPRDLPALFELLDRLDYASLAAQRKLTIPFVRKFL